MLKKYSETQQQVAELEQFVQGDIVWLEELRRISQAAPPPGDAIATQFRATLQANNTGKIALEGVVVDAALLEDFEARMRNAAHRVSGVGGTYEERGELPWQFNETITIDPTQLGSEPSDTPPQPEAGGA